MAFNNDKFKAFLYMLIIGILLLFSVFSFGQHILLNQLITLI